MSAIYTDELIEHMHRMGDLGFPEITTWLARRGVPTEGDHYINAQADPNIFLWAGMSEQVCDESLALLDHPDVEIEPFGAGLPSSVVDLTLGGGLDLPLVKHPPESGYREPHWLPVVLRHRKPRSLDGR